MKATIRVISLGFFFAASLLVTSAAVTADPSQKVLLDNASATVVKVTYAPGAVLHTHGPGRVIYVLSGPYHSTWKTADGRTITVVHGTGEAYWFPGGNVTVTNTGTNTVRVLAVIQKK